MGKTSACRSIPAKSASAIESAVAQSGITLTGDSGADLIDAGGGDDVVFGGDESDAVPGTGDQIFGGVGGDVIFGNAGEDTIYGDTQDDIDGGDADVIFGYADDDRIYGGAGTDQILGGDGDDILDGGPAADTVLGEGDDDSITWSRAVNGTDVDSIDGGTGYNSLHLIGLPVDEDLEVSAPITPGTSVHVAWSNPTVVIEPFNIQYLKIDLDKGADTATVGSLVGSALSQFQIDLGDDPAEAGSQNVIKSSYEVGSVVGNFGSFAGVNGSVIASVVSPAGATSDEVRQVYTNATTGAFTLTFDTRDEHQSIYVTGGATGTFTLKFGGKTTGNLDVHATALQVQQALEGLSTIGVGDVKVSGSGTIAEPWDVHFVNILGATNLDQLTSLNSSVIIDTVVTGSPVPATSTPIPYNATSDQISSVLSSLTGDNITATGTGTQADPWEITFVGSAASLVPDWVAGNSGMVDVDRFAGLEDTSGDPAPVTIATIQPADATHNEIRSISHDGVRGAFSLILDEVNEVQQVVHDANQGSFTLAFNGHGSAPLDWNISAANLRTALENVPGIGAGNVTVDLGATSTTWTIEFVNNLAGQSVPQLVANFSGLSKASGSAVTASADTLVAGGAVGTDLIEHDASPDVLAAVLSKAASRTFIVTGAGTTSNPWRIEIDKSQGMTIPAWTAVTTNTSGYGSFELQDDVGHPAHVTISNKVSVGPTQDAQFEIYHDGTSGGFTLTYADETTRILDFDVTASDLADALNALTPNAITVLVSGSGSMADPWIVDFQNSAGMEIGQITANVSGVDYPVGSPATFVSSTVTAGSDGARNEVQQIVHDSSSDSFRLGLGGVFTAELAANVSAADLQAALGGLSTIGNGNVTVALLGSGNGWIVTFVNVLGNQNVDAIIGTSTGNGAAPVTITTSTDGTNGNELQQLWHNATGGTFTLGFNNATTAALDFDADAATIQAALEVLSTIGTGNIQVSGSGTEMDPWQFEFINKLGHQDQTEFSINQSALTFAASNSKKVRAHDPDRRQWRSGSADALS